jgi:hypothetical protein
MKIKVNVKSEGVTRTEAQLVCAALRTHEMTLRHGLQIDLLGKMISIVAKLTKPPPKGAGKAEESSDQRIIKDLRRFADEMFPDFEVILEPEADPPA